MVLQSKIAHAFGAVLGLYNVLGAQGHWIGAMGEPGDLARRAVPSCSPGYVACGNSGCVEESLCCNQDAGWNCAEGNACYTVSGTVDCYSATNAMPTTARACYDYTQPGCSGVGCFKCVSTAAPYCYTEILYATSEIWIDCTVSSTAFTVGSVRATATGPRTTTQSGSGSTTRTSTSGSSFPTTTSSSPITSTPITTPAAVTGPGIPFSHDSSSSSSSSKSSGLSGGAIAGIAIGAFAVIAIIAVLAFFLWKKSKNSDTQNRAQPMEAAQMYPPPQPPFSPALPGYQSTQTPVSYHEQPKGHYYPQQQQPQHQPGQVPGYGPVEMHAPPAELS